MSSPQRKAGAQGTRTWFWTRDLGMESQIGGFYGAEDNLTIATDVDYYLPLPRLLSQNCTGVPVLLSTFVPQQANGVVGATSWTFDEENNLDVIISGGARYRHGIWDTSQDVVFTWSVEWYACIPVFRAVAYSVERKPVSEHHMMVAFVPVARACNWFGALSLWLSAPTMTRFNPVTTTVDK